MITPDRHTAPPIGLPEEIKISPAETQQLSNGTPLYLINAGTQDVVKVELIFAAGNIASSQTLLAAAANDLLDEGTSRYNSAELAEALDYYGAYLQTENGADWASASLFSLNKFVGDTLPYLIDLLTDPIYPEKEIITYKTQGKQRLAVGLNKVDFLVRRHFMQALYGDQHPYGRISNPEDYDALSTTALRSYYDQHYRKGLKAIIISGRPDNATISAIKKSIEAAGFSNSELPEFNLTLPTPRKQLVEKKDAIQSAIRIGRRLFNRKHADYFTFTVMNTILGGYFGSRLMSNIREDKGYTYGIGSGLVSHHDDGYFFISTEVGADVREAAIKEIYFELHRLREEDVPLDELNLVKNYLVGSFQRSIDGPFAQADRHKILCLNNLDTGYYENYLRTIKNVTPNDIRACAEKYLQEDQLTEIVAGK
ncbi:MAG: insulinase family protein [Bacteroidia bacterium]|nr:insulinase family protein [Bacteroidia bacterium]